MMNAAKELLGIDRYCYVKEFTKWNYTGSTLSVKIVVPCFCQAHCPFCFNKLTTETQEHDYMKFFTNLKVSLDNLFATVTNRKISLDITGNEPTFNVGIFRHLMAVLREYKDRTERIVLTTNGFNLAEVLNDMAGVVDIVNISLHHYDAEVRKNEIFRTGYIPNNRELAELIHFGNELGITFTAVAVLYKKFEDMEVFYHNFMAFALQTGFKDVRFRCNFCNKDSLVTEVENINFPGKKVVDVAALKTIFIEDDILPARVLIGVCDLTEYVIGVELVVDDDGNTYVDYNKRYPVTKDKLHVFTEGMFCFDKKDLAAM